MRAPQRYLLTIAATYALTNFALSFYSTGLDLYISVYIVEYFILTLLHSPLSPKTQQITNRVSYILFGVLIITAIFEILQIAGVNLL